MYKFITKTKKEIIIRPPKMSDLKSLTDYMNALSKERTFIMRQGEILTLAEERKWLTKFLKNIKEKKGVYLVAIFKNKVIGMGSMFVKNNTTHKHVGESAISIAKDFRGEGIGKILMEKIMSEAKKNITGLKTIILSVFAINEVAINLYKKLGFKNYGLLPNGIVYKGKYVHEVFMYKNLR